MLAAPSSSVVVCRRRRPHAVCTCYLRPAPRSPSSPSSASLPSSSPMRAHRCVHIEALRQPGPFTMAVLRRPAAPGPAPEPGALRAHCERALDAFFAEQSPLLTPERERALRGAFDGEARPLAEAYGLLFAGAERDEYSLEDFLEDAAACAGSRGDPGRMSADEAVEFLRSNQ
ncbi:unnamed protein product [Prorocentrum cordatum]|uniref:Uncharacterized protein n=1 Tax=Prorocentrum cordatum TaxID=2364126 RepID=A0ABN9VMX8_9DINO|nr:unnamed protein product [Polarella glacialis]